MMRKLNRLSNRRKKPSRLSSKASNSPKRRSRLRKEPTVPGSCFADWDQYFMSMAFFVAMKSKDPSTKVGTVVVGPDNEIRSTGFNGLPKGMEETKKRYKRPGKYLYHEHSERNALYQVAGSSQSVRGCTLYTPWVPCCDCARGIIQSRISEVVVYFPVNHLPKWSEEGKESIIMFKEARVKLRWFKGDLVTQIACWADEKRVF